MAKYIAVDLGAESGRVVTATLAGDRLALEEVYRFANGAVQVDNSLYWDVLHLWDEIKKGLHKAHTEHGAELRSVAVDTWGIDYALLNRAGELVGNPHCYRASRIAGMMERAFERVPRWEIYRQSGGIQFLSINTLYQLLAMVERQDPALDAAATFLMIPDLFHYWLTGRKVCEFTDATSTQFYRAATGGWSTDLLARLGIPTDIFPEVVLPGTVLGPLLPGVAEETGLGSLPVVAPAGGPRHGLGHRRGAGGERALRLAELGHVVAARRHFGRADRDARSAGGEFQQLRRTRRPLPALEEHHGSVAGAGMSPRVGAHRRGSLLRPTNRPGRGRQAICGNRQP